MPVKIVRNDITKMNTEAIVNTAGSTTIVGEGCDSAVYKAAGYDKLHSLRMEIGNVPEGEAFITPGFDLPARYIIHAVSPLYFDGESGEEAKLRSCYRNSLKLAVENQVKSISFPLISTGSFGYPMADGLSIAMDEINRFLLEHDLDVTIVVFSDKATGLASKLSGKLKKYIDNHYVASKLEEEYGAPILRDRVESQRFDGAASFGAPMAAPMPSAAAPSPAAPKSDKAGYRNPLDRIFGGKDSRQKSVESEPDTRLYTEVHSASYRDDEDDRLCENVKYSMVCDSSLSEDFDESDELDYIEDIDTGALHERLKHISDPFGTYVLYLAESKGLSGADVQNRAWITKQVWHKIKKNAATYHPDKVTALRLCIAFDLNLDESRDFLARAGYAFSPCRIDDMIWQFGIEYHLDVLDISELLEDYQFPALVNF